MINNPPDLSMAITYTIGNNASGTAAGSPYDIKADINGNIWVAGVANSGLASSTPTASSSRPPPAALIPPTPSPPSPSNP